jgi:hypothetical protein
MQAELLAAFIAVEHRREDLQRQGRRNEARRAFQGCQHRVAQRARHRMILGQLRVVLHLGGLIAGGAAAILPGGLGQRLGAGGEPRRAQHIGNGDQHRITA